MARAFTVLIAGGFAVFPLAFVSTLKPNGPGYGAICLSIVLLGGVVASVMMWYGWKKQSREIENGYTPVIKIAIENPDLYLVDYKTFAVVSAPNGTRPPAPRKFSSRATPQ